jgi:orotidine-5'-phosphate decarboxylase
MRPYALVLSNDIVEKDKMLDVTKQTRDYVDGVKIGITSSMESGIDAFAMARDIVGDGPAILADYKVADIGFYGKEKWSGTNEKIVRNLSEAGANYITCHSFMGLSSIEESVVTAHKYGSRVLTLPFMTNKGADLFFGMELGVQQVEHILQTVSDYGLERSEETIEFWNNLYDSKSVSDVILSMGEQFGVDGYIGPGNNPEVLERYRMFSEKEIWSPGFGRQDKKGRDLETQIREWAEVVGPNSAMIVGSLIYKADDPALAAREVMEIRDRVVSEL